MVDLWIPTTALPRDLRRTALIQLNAHTLVVDVVATVTIRRAALLAYMLMEI